MTMDNGEGRPLDELEAGQQDPQGWYFDLPSDAWRRQEEKNRLLRERVRNQRDEEEREAPRRDPFMLRRPEPEPPKKRGLFGFGRKKKHDQTEPPRRPTERGAGGAGIGWLTDDDDDDWSTERPVLPAEEPSLRLRPRGDEPRDDAPGGVERSVSPEPPPLRLRPRRQEESGKRLDWDFGPAAWPDGSAAGRSDEPGIENPEDEESIFARMHAWAERGREAKHGTFGLGHDDRQEDGRSDEREGADSRDHGTTAWVPAAAEPAAGESAIEAPGAQAEDEASAGLSDQEATAGGSWQGLSLRPRREERERAHEERRSSKWDEFFGLNREEGEEEGARFSEGLAAMREWAKKKPLSGDIREIPEEFLKPFDWELEEQQARGIEEPADEEDPFAEFRVGPAASGESHAPAAAAAPSPWLPAEEPAEEEDPFAAFRVAPAASEESHAPAAAAAPTAWLPEEEPAEEEDPFAAFRVAPVASGESDAPAMAAEPTAWLPEEEPAGEEDPFAAFRVAPAQGATEDPLEGIFPARRDEPEPPIQKRGFFGRLFGRKEPVPVEEPPTPGTAWWLEPEPEQPTEEAREPFATGAEDARADQQAETAEPVSNSPAGAPGRTFADDREAEAVLASESGSAGDGERVERAFEWAPEPVVLDEIERVATDEQGSGSGGDGERVETAFEWAPEPVMLADLERVAADERESGSAGDGERVGTAFEWATEPVVLDASERVAADERETGDAGEGKRVETAFEWAPEPVVLDDIERVGADQRESGSAGDGKRVETAFEWAAGPAASAPAAMEPSDFAAAIQAALWGDPAGDTPAQAAAEVPWWERESLATGEGERDLADAWVSSSDEPGIPGFAQDANTAETPPAPVAEAPWWQRESLATGEGERDLADAWASSSDEPGVPGFAQDDNAAETPAEPVAEAPWWERESLAAGEGESDLAGAWASSSDEPGVPGFAQDDNTAETPAAPVAEVPWWERESLAAGEGERDLAGAWLSSSDEPGVPGFAQDDNTAETPEAPVAEVPWWERLGAEPLNTTAAAWPEHSAVRDEPTAARAWSLPEAGGAGVGDDTGDDNMWSAIAERTEAALSQPAQDESRTDIAAFDDADSGWRRGDEAEPAHEGLAVPHTGEEVDVILRAFEAHAAAADPEEEAAEAAALEAETSAALAALFGEQGRAIIEEVGEEPAERPFIRMAAWAPQRSAPADDGWAPQEEIEAEQQRRRMPVGFQLDPEALTPPWVTEPADDAESAPTAKRSSVKAWVREVVETAMLAALVFLSVRASFGNFKVDGNSMYPTLENGEFLIVNKLVYSEVNLEKLSTFLPFIDPGDDPTRYVFHGPQRGDIVVLRDPRDPSTDLIKRIIGLPGETIEIVNGKVYINDRLLEEPYITAPWNDTLPKIVIPPDEYFVMGDNRNNSLDSRSAQVGLVSKDLIIGKATLTYLPLNRFGLAPNKKGVLTEQKPVLTTKRLGEE